MPNSIDELDRQIIELVRRRAQAVGELSEPDGNGNAGLGTACQNNQRLEQLLDEDQGGCQDDGLKRVLQHVNSYCRGQVASHATAFLGPKYSYSHLAAIKYFGEGAQFAPVANIPAVFDAVHRGDAQSGLVPIENSTDGGVVDTLGMFVQRHMQICGEVVLPIHHNLLATGSREQITQIHSKPQALSQCRGWLSANFPSAELVEVGSTTAAAESAAADTKIAAVASLPAGRAYGLTVLNQSIEDSADNVTRFAVLGREEPQPTGRDKTSILFQVAHQPGSLADAMAIFSDAKLNLTWIESFPAPHKRNEYLFFAEFSGHRAETRAGNAIKELDAMTQRLDILGSYPIASL